MAIKLSSADLEQFLKQLKSPLRRHNISRVNCLKLVKMAFFELPLTLKKLITGEKSVQI